MWRGAITAAVARESLDAFDKSPIRARADARLGARAWAIADRLGWAKTYDAEYLALAELLSCRILTLDNGIRDAAERLAIRVLQR
jgi:predicted nucleic acid-binding protein